MYFTIKRCVDGLGRIVLPKDMRDYYGIKTGDIVEFIATENDIFIKIPSESNKQKE